MEDKWCHSAGSGVRWEKNKKKGDALEGTNDFNLEGTYWNNRRKVAANGIHNQTWDGSHVVAVDTVSWRGANVEE